MAGNYNSLGQNVTFDLGVGPAPTDGSAIQSGDFVKVGNIYGIAQCDEFVDGGERYVVAATEGVWELPVTGTYAFGAVVSSDLSIGGTDQIGVAIGYLGDGIMKVRIQQLAK